MDIGRRPRSRWDRAAPPRDWRWAVGTVGKILIATGVLMFGFVAYQLWGTGIEYAQAQDELDSELDNVIGPTTESTAPITTVAGVPPVETVTPTLPTDTTVPGTPVPVAAG